MIFLWRKVRAFLKTELVCVYVIDFRYYSQAPENLKLSNNWTPICEILKGKLAENVTAQDEAFAVECIGTLANLNLPTIDYSLVLAEYDLLKWLKSTLSPDSPAQDDIVLESVLLATVS